MRTVEVLKCLRFAIAAALLLASALVQATVYQTADQFVGTTLGAQAQAQKMWLSKAQKAQAADILGHKMAALRLRYWRDGQKTAWVFDEIGKEEPITVGVVVDEQGIVQVAVLAYRESRGWEVKHDFFLDQFLRLGLTEELRLNGRVQGITGATLSVRAVRNVTRLALYFHQQVADNG